MPAALPASFRQVLRPGRALLTARLAGRPRPGHGSALRGVGGSARPLGGAGGGGDLQEPRAGEVSRLRLLLLPRGRRGAAGRLRLPGPRGAVAGERHPPLLAVRAEEDPQLHGAVAHRGPPCGARLLRQRQLQLLHRRGVEAGGRVAPALRRVPALGAHGAQLPLPPGGAGAGALQRCPGSDGDVHLAHSPIGDQSRICCPRTRTR